MKQFNDTYHEALQFNRLEVQDLEHMASCADTAEQLELDADELAEHRAFFAELCELVDMPDRFPSISSDNDRQAILAAINKVAQ